MRFFAAAIVLMLLSSGGAATADKPKLTLKANPVMAFSPARIHVTADLTGGANNDQTLYCPAVEWEWGDGTKSAEESDCEPYQAGKSEIKRHYIADHEFRIEEQNFAGAPPDYRDFHIQLRLKRSGKVVLSAATSVKIKPESDR
jgi:hypothetical protein